MSRKFIATILAASIAVTGLTTAPAKAGNDDLAKILAGAATIVILGKIIESERNDRVTVTTRTPQHYHGKPKAHVAKRTPGNYKAPNARHSRVNRQLPAGCRVVVNTRQGPVQGFGKLCLETHMADANRVPNFCRVDVRQIRGNEPRSLYNGRCLARNGYTVKR